MAEVAVQLESGCHGLNSKDEETETAGTGGEYCVQLETKFIRMFPKISQSRRRPLLGPSPG